MNRREFLKITLGGAAAPFLLAAKPTPAASNSKGMRYRTLGRTGQQVSIIGLGGAHIGLPSLTDIEAISIVRTAVDNDVNFLDNSWDYNGGESERRMGAAIEGDYRLRVFLMTKIDGRTAKAATDQLHQSLKRLRTDYVDLIQFHEIIRSSDPERIFAQGGALEAMEQARKQGKVRFIGFTGHKSPEIHLQMLQAGFQHGFVFDTVQMPINVMDAQYESFLKKVAPVARAHNIGTIGMKPMGAGLILKSGAVTARDALRFSLSQQTDVVVTGCDSMATLNQALDIASSFHPMSNEEQTALLAKTSAAARDGKYELYKTTTHFDATAHHPEYLG
jgi:uncharacterized protein